jgi:transposase
MSSTSGRVVIGMDPHKRSATVEVMSANETILAGGRFGTDRDGYAALLRYGKQWPDRVWAIEGCAGIGKHIANRLLADGEAVVDVPPKLSARARVFATGQGRKTDASDAHSVALVGTRMAGLRPVVNDEQIAVLRILVDRRRSLGEDHTRMVSQLHQLLLELIPGGAKKDLSARQAKALLEKVRPRDAAGKTRRRVAAELISDLERIYARRKAANKELTELVAATGTGLLDLNGIGPSGAARLLVEVGDITRFPDQGALRVLERHRAHRRVLRRPGPPPALPRRQPADQPRAAHHGPRPDPQPQRGPRLLRAEEGRRQSADGGDAVREATTVRHRLPPDAQRRAGADGDGPGRTPGNVYRLQRDRLTSPCRFFG